MPNAHTQGEVLHEHHTSTGDSGLSWIIGLIVLIVLAWLLFAYGLPLLQSTNNPQINIPGQIDVNLNQPGQGGATTPQ